MFNNLNLIKLGSKFKSFNEKTKKIFSNKPTKNKTQISLTNHIWTQPLNILKIQKKNSQHTASNSILFSCLNFSAFPTVLCSVPQSDRLESNDRLYFYHFYQFSTLIPYFCNCLFSSNPLLYTTLYYSIPSTRLCYTTHNSLKCCCALGMMMLSDDCYIQ